MRKIVNHNGHRKTLDTTTALQLDARSFHQYGDPCGYEEVLYQSPAGTYFVWGQGGDESPYPEPSLRLVSEQQALNFKMRLPLDSPLSNTSPSWAPVELVALDMDGTLLNSQKHILPSSLEAIRAAQSRGCAVALCTGRSPEMLSVYQDELQDIRYAITNSGATVLDRSKLSAHDPARGVLFEVGLDKALLGQLCKLVAHGDYVFEMFADKSSYMQADCLDELESHHLGPFRSLLEEHTNFVQDILEWVQHTDSLICKFNVHTTSPEERQQLRARLSHLPVSMANTEVSSLEISPLGISKATGLHELCKALGIDPAHTIAVGDSGNDVEVLRAAGLGVAMGNADAETIAASQVQVADCDSGGIAEVFERFVL